MLVEFTRHSDTSIGRCKIGSIVDLPKEEVEILLAQKQCVLLEPPIEVQIEEEPEFAESEEVLEEEEEDGSRDDQ